MTWKLFIALCTLTAKDLRVFILCALKFSFSTMNADDLAKDAGSLLAELMADGDRSS